MANAITVTTVKIKGRTKSKNANKRYAKILVFADSRHSKAITIKVISCIYYF